MSALLLPLVQSLALRPMPHAPRLGASAAGAADGDGAAPFGRRQLLASAGAASALALLGLPRQAEASYALYQASQVTRACARATPPATTFPTLLTSRDFTQTFFLFGVLQDSYLDRQKTGFVPVATNDRATLRSIQSDIAQKRPEYLKKKATKKVQYCAGQTAAVTPLLENKCETIGLSKADQTNTQRDDFGNMNIGVFGGGERFYKDKNS